MTVIPDPSDGTKMLSARNILEGSRNVFDQERFRPFGSGAIARIPTQRRDKGIGRNKGFKAVIVGYLPAGNGYKVESMETKKLYDVGYSNVITYETTFPWKDRQT